MAACDPDKKPFDCPTNKEMQLHLERVMDLKEMQLRLERVMDMSLIVCVMLGLEYLFGAPPASAAGLAAVGGAVYFHHPTPKIQERPAECHCVGGAPHRWGDRPCCGWKRL